MLQLVPWQLKVIQRVEYPLIDKKYVLDVSATIMEYNARNQLTLWGPDGEINDYARKGKDLAYRVIHTSI